MIENFQILQSIIENSGREGYITDKSFNILWTNSEKSLVEILLKSSHSGISQSKKKETAIACSDGSALKITPLIVNGENEGYLFERYESNQIVDLLSKTSVFRRFSEECNTFREATFEIMTNLSSDSTNNQETGNEKIDEIYTGTINKSNMLKILAYDFEPQTFDLYIPVSYCCGLMHMTLQDSDTKIVSDIKQGLYVSIHHSTFEYVLMNLLLNAYSYCDSPSKIISVKSYRDKSNVVLEISDNGKKCDLNRINSFRTIFANERSIGSEGLGIAIAQVFSDKNQCTIEFTNSETGGLCVKMRFPYQIPDANVALYAPTERNGDFSLYNLMKKCFTESELMPLKTKIKS